MQPARLLVSSSSSLAPAAGADGSLSPPLSQQQQQPQQQQHQHQQQELHDATEALLALRRAGAETQRIAESPGDWHPTRPDKWRRAVTADTLVGYDDGNDDEQQDEEQEPRRPAGKGPGDGDETLTNHHGNSSTATHHDGVHGRLAAAAAVANDTPTLRLHTDGDDALLGATGSSATADPDFDERLRRGNASGGGSGSGSGDTHHQHHGERGESAAEPGLDTTPHMRELNRPCGASQPNKESADALQRAGGQCHAQDGAVTPPRSLSPAAPPFLDPDFDRLCGTYAVSTLGVDASELSLDQRRPSPQSHSVPPIQQYQQEPNQQQQHTPTTTDGSETDDEGYPHGGEDDSATKRTASEASAGRRRRQRRSDDSEVSAAARPPVPGALVRPPTADEVSDGVRAVRLVAGMPLDALSGRRYLTATVADAVAGDVVFYVDAAELDTAAVPGDATPPAAPRPKGKKGRAATPAAAAASRRNSASEATLDIVWATKRPGTARVPVKSIRFNSKTFAFLRMALATSREQQQQQPQQKRQRLEEAVTAVDKAPAFPSATAAAAPVHIPAPCLAVYLAPSARRLLQRSRAGESEARRLDDTLTALTRRGVSVVEVQPYAMGVAHRAAAALPFAWMACASGGGGGGCDGAAPALLSGLSANAQSGTSSLDTVLGYSALGTPTAFFVLVDDDTTAGDGGAEDDDDETALAAALGVSAVGLRAWLAHVTLRDDELVATVRTGAGSAASETVPLLTSPYCPAFYRQCDMAGSTAQQSLRTWLLPSYLPFRENARALSGKYVMFAESNADDDENSAAARTLVRAAGGTVCVTEYPGSAVVTVFDDRAGRAVKVAEGTIRPDFVFSSHNGDKQESGVELLTPASLRQQIWAHFATHRTDCVVQHYQESPGATSGGRTHLASGHATLAAASASMMKELADTLAERATGRLLGSVRKADNGAKAQAEDDDDDEEGERDLVVRPSEMAASRSVAAPLVRGPLGMPPSPNPRSIFFPDSAAAAGAGDSGSGPGSDQRAADGHLAARVASLRRATATAHHGRGRSASDGRPFQETLNDYTPPPASATEGSSPAPHAGLASRAANTATTAVTSSRGLAARTAASRTPVPRTRQPHGLSPAPYTPAWSAAATGGHDGHGTSRDRGDDNGVGFATITVGEDYYFVTARQPVLPPLAHQQQQHPQTEQQQQQQVVECIAIGQVVELARADGAGGQGPNITTAHGETSASVGPATLREVAVRLRLYEERRTCMWVDAATGRVRQHRSVRLTDHYQTVTAADLLLRENVYVLDSHAAANTFLLDDEEEGDDGGNA